MNWLVSWLIAYAQRKPFWNLDGYMERWWVFEPHWWTLGCSARIHHILRSDNDRHFHDHPWPTISIILRGKYHEHFPYPLEPKWRKPGSVIFRKATTQHILHVPPNSTCWSLFLMGPKKQQWGFYTQHGKIPSHMYEAYLLSESDDLHRRAP